MRNGDHNQSTNSIFNRNDAVVHKRDMQKFYRDAIEKLGDVKRIYEEPKDKF